MSEITRADIQLIREIVSSMTFRHDEDGAKTEGIWRAGVALADRLEAGLNYDPEIESQNNMKETIEEQPKPTEYCAECEYLKSKNGLCLNHAPKQTEEWADEIDKPTIEEVRKAFLPETVEKLGWQDFREYNHASNYRNELILANKIDELIQVYGDRLDRLEGKGK